MKQQRPFILLVLLLLTSAACSKQEEITSYSVPKSKSAGPLADAPLG